MPSYGPLQRRGQEDAYRRDQERKWHGGRNGCEGGGRRDVGGQSRNYPRPIGPCNSIAHPPPPLRRSPVPDRDIIFSKTRNSPISTGIMRERFISSTDCASLPFLHPHCLPTPSPPTSFNRFRRDGKTPAAGRNILIYRCTAIHP